MGELKRLRLRLRELKRYKRLKGLKRLKRRKRKEGRLVKSPIGDLGAKGRKR